MPAAATEYSFFIPKAEYRDIEVSEIRCLVEFLQQAERTVPVAVKVNFVFGSE